MAVLTATALRRDMTAICAKRSSTASSSRKLVLPDFLAAAPSREMSSTIALVLGHAVGVLVSLAGLCALPFAAGAGCLVQSGGTSLKGFLRLPLFLCLSEDT
jgi:hypothetical protein